MVHHLASRLLKVNIDVKEVGWKSELGYSGSGLRPQVGSGKYLSKAFDSLKYD